VSQVPWGLAVDVTSSQASSNMTLSLKKIEEAFRRPATRVCQIALPFVCEA
jgi:hypothetical protein